MALPASREQLKEWALRKLGKPVIKINVSDQQVEDRVDETLERFQEFHFDGVERYYLKRQVTASTMTFSSPLGFTFQDSESITGGTSGAVGHVVSQASNNLSITFRTVSGLFVTGETITGGSGSAVIATITLGDIDNKWIPTDDSILAVTMLMPGSGVLGGGVFSHTYQQALQFMPTFPSGEMSNYFMQRQSLALIEEMFIGDKMLTFNRLQNKLYVSLNWETVKIGDYLVIECYKALNPETYKRVYKNWFIREYLTVLIKKQWGQNLSKFQGVTMPGGVTLNGDQIYSQAITELDTLEEKLRTEMQLPPGMFLG